MRARRTVFPLALALACAGAGPAAQTEDDFFNPDVVHEIRIRINPGDWQKLKASFLTNTYYPCVFQWRDLVLDNAGIRSRGLSTRNDIKPGLRVDFNRYEEGQTFLGLKSVHLKNSAADASMLKDRLAMLFFQRMGLPAPRTAHARLYINNSYSGLYLLTESIDKHFLRRHFKEDEGYLYKYEYAGPYYFEYRGPDPARYSPSPFEPQTHEIDPNPAPIAAMIRTINESSDADFEGRMAEYLDLKLFLTHLAVENFLAEEDGITGEFGLANFYFYRFDQKNLSQFLVWDKDHTFSDLARSIWRNTADNVLVRRALAVPALRRAYLEALWRCAALAGGAGGWLEQEILRTYNLIRASVLEDPLKLCPPVPWAGLRGCSNQEFEQEVARLVRFAQDRGGSVACELDLAGFQVSNAAPLLTGASAAGTDGGPAHMTPGSLIRIEGERLAAAVFQAASLPLPHTLGGASFLINGLPAPVLMVSPRAAVVQVPWEVVPGRACVTAVVNGLSSPELAVIVGLTSPSVIAVLHPDGVPVSLQRPLEGGKPLVIFATGLGPVTPLPCTGQAAPSQPPAVTVNTPRVTIAGTPAEVTFSGLAPGAAGVYQINVITPPLGAGNNPVLVVISGAEVSAPVTISSR